jgi:uncharacterized glyoxalase superfamily protein PhnB
MQSVYPTLRYQDANAAIDWLERAFGLERKEVYEDAGIVTHAEMRWRGSLIMLGGERPSDRENGYASRIGNGWLYVVVDDPDAHHDRAKAAGAEIVMELTDQPYGSRDYQALDLEGNRWSFGTYDPTASGL